MNRLKAHQTSLILAAIVSVVLWAVPVFGFVLLPLQYLNTHLHEFCHAFMAMLSGGEVDHIDVFANGSGVTLASGSGMLVNPAGYIGATIIGGLIILTSRSPRGAAISLRIAAVTLAFSLVFWVRGDLIGIVSAVFWICVLFALPHFVRDSGLVFVAQLIGMQQCLASIQALYVLFRVSAYPKMQSDAANMAQSTGIPALVWAVLWGAIGLAVLAFTLRAAWSNRSKA